MTQAAIAERTVYRLYPDFGKTRGLLLDEASLLRLLRIQRTGAGPAPDNVQALWTADEETPLGDFPCGLGFAPVVARHLCERFNDDLRKAGHCVPILAPGLEGGAYLLYVVERMVDCLDVVHSTKPKRSGEMARLVFLHDRLDTTVPAFRIPQSPAFVFWNGWFVDQLMQSGAKGVETLAVWSQDPAIKIAPKPMR